MSLLLGVIVGLTSVDGETTSSAGAGGYGFLVAIIVYGIGLVTSLCMVGEQANNLGLGSRLWAIMGWHGPDRLRKMINCTDNPSWTPMEWKSEMETLYKPHLVSMSFGFLLKYFIPTILWVLFFTTFKNNVNDGYGGYPWSYQTVGMLIFAFMAILVLFVAIFPRSMIDPRESGDSTVMGQIKWTFSPSQAKSDKNHEDSGVYGVDDVVILNHSSEL